MNTWASAGPACDSAAPDRPRAIEPDIGVRRNGVFLVFGQTAMFSYLAHRLMFEVPATYFGLRGAGGLVTAYIVAFAMLTALYPARR